MATVKESECGVQSNKDQQVKGLNNNIEERAFLKGMEQENKIRCHSHFTSGKTKVSASDYGILHILLFQDGN